MTKYPYQMSIDKLVGKHFTMRYEGGFERNGRLRQDDNPFSGYDFISEPDPKTGDIWVLGIPNEIRIVEVVGYGVIKRVSDCGTPVKKYDKGYKKLYRFVTSK